MDMIEEGMNLAGIPDEDEIVRQRERVEKAASEKETASPADSNTSQLLIQENYASMVYDTLIKKDPTIKCFIVNKDGRCLISNLDSWNTTLEHGACILNLSDKIKVLLRKVLPDEELKSVRINSIKNEIIITIDESVEIITIQKPFGL